MVTHYIGLNTSEITELRSKVREAGARFCVAKNSLVKIASKETPYEALENYFKGPTAIIFSKDPIAGIKVVKKYSDENEKFKSSADLAYKQISLNLSKRIEYTEVEEKYSVLIILTYPLFLKTT